VRKNSWPATHLARARSTRPGEKGALAWVADSRLGEIATEALGGFVNARLDEPSSLERGHPSSGLRLQQHAKAPTRSRLGERLSLERYSTSLKTRVLRLSESLRIDLACFCKSRLGETGSLGWEYQISPLFSLHNHIFHIQITTQGIPQVHNNIQSIQTPSRLQKQAKNDLKLKTLTSLTWIVLAKSFDT